MNCHSLARSVNREEPHFDVLLTPIAGHEGQRYMVSSSIMKCEFPVQAQDVPVMLGRLFNEFLDLIDVEIPGQRRFRINIGQSPKDCHSFRDFFDPDEAIAFMWALAKAEHFEIAWYWQGMDGWMCNRHLIDKESPQRLSSLVEKFVAELNAPESA